MFSEDLDVFFQDFGVNCTSGVLVFRGLFDCPDSLVASGMIINTENALMVKTSVANQITGSQLTADGITYKILNIQKVEDGKISVIELGK